MALSYLRTSGLPKKCVFQLFTDPPHGSNVLPKLLPFPKLYLVVSDNSTSTKKQMFTDGKPLSTSAIKNNNNASSPDSILLADSCVKRIKEIADDAGYLRVMVSSP